MLSKLYSDLSNDHEGFNEVFQSEGEFKTALGSDAKSVYDTWVKGHPSDPGMESIVSSLGDDPKKKKNMGPAPQTSYWDARLGNGTGNTNQGGEIVAPTYSQPKLFPKEKAPASDATSTQQTFIPAATLERKQVQNEISESLPQILNNAEQTTIGEKVQKFNDYLDQSWTIYKPDGTTETIDQPTDADIGKVLIEGGRVNLSKGVNIDRGLYSSESFVLDPDMFNKYLETKGLTEENAQKQIEFYKDQYLRNEAKKTRDNFISLAEQASKGDQRKTVEEYHAQMDNVGFRALRSELPTADIDDINTVYTLESKIREGKKLTGQEGGALAANGQYPAGSEMRMLTDARNRLIDSLHGELLYDPISGQRYKQDKAPESAVNYAKKRDSALNIYTNNFNGDLRKTRDELYFQRLTLSDELTKMKSTYPGVDYGSPDVSERTVSAYKDLEKRWVETAAQYSAANLALMANIKPQPKGEDELAANARKGFVQGVENSVGITNTMEYSTQKDKVRAYVEALDKVGPGATEQERASAQISLGEEVAYSMAAMIPVVVEQIITRNIMPDFKVIRGTSIFKNMESGISSVLGKSAGEFMTDLTAHAVHGAIVYGPTSETAATGVGEAVFSQGLFDKLGIDKGIKNPFIRFIAKVFLGTVGETLEEFSGQYVDALSQTGFDWKKSADRAFGTNMDEFTRQLVVIGMSSGIMSAGFNLPELAPKFTSVRDKLQDEINSGRVSEQNIPAVQAAINVIDNTIKSSLSDSEHAEKIKGDLISVFTGKGVPEEQVKAAIELMDARANASGQGDAWYKNIQGVGTGNFNQQSPVLLQLPEGKVIGLPVEPEVINSFYSPLEKQVLNLKQERGTGEQMLGMLKGAKEDELKWTGLTDWLKSQGKVTKQDIIDYLKNNRVQLVEVVHSNDDFYFDPSTGETTSETNTPRAKYEQYQLPGGRENYREILVTMPAPDKLNSKEQLELQELEAIPSMNRKHWQNKRMQELYDKVPEGKKKQFRSSHWDEPNIIGHLRISNRVDAEGNKVLHISEVQSDWGQKGKKEGFETDERKKVEAEIAKLWDEQTKTQREYQKILNEVRKERPNASVHSEEQRGNKELIAAVEKERALQDKRMMLVNSIRDERSGGVEKQIPTAPFVTNTSNWTKLLLKYAIKEAVKDGATHITWETGETQNERYDLSKQVDKVSIANTSDGYDVEVVKKGTTFWTKVANGLNEKKLEETVGKELASKHIESGSDAVQYEGLDLKVGGKGMIGFYGSPAEGKEGIVGKIAKELVKELTGKEVKVGETKINSGVNKEVDGEVNFYELTDGEYAVEYKGEQKEFDNITDAENYYNSIAKSITTQHSIEITPELKKSVEKGMPLFQDGKGAIESLPNGKKIIHALQAPDFSTLVHEMAHIFEDELSEQDRQVIIDWAQTESWTRQTSETFARGFERYLRDGNSPTKTLAQLFERMKGWLTDIYKTVVGSSIEKSLSPEIKKIFDGLLSNKNEFEELTRRMADAFPGSKVEFFSDYNHKVGDQTIEELFKADGTTSLQTPGSKLYGFVHNGVVYLNQTEMDANTAIHEFGHIWTNVMRNTDNARYQQGMGFVEKYGMKYLEDVKSNSAYNGLSEDAQKEEALARMIGDKGAKMFDEGKLDPEYKRSFMEWLSDMFGWLSQKLGVQLTPDSPLDHFVKSAIKDMTGGNTISDVKNAYNDNSQASINRDNYIGRVAPQDLINRVSDIKNDAQTKGIAITDTDIAKQLVEEGHDISQLRTELPDIGITAWNTLRKDAALRTFIQTRVNWNDRVARAQQILNQNPVMGIQEHYDALLQEGYREFEIFNALVEFGYDQVGGLNDIFGVEYAETINHVQERADIPTGTLASLSEDVRTRKITRSMSDLMDTAADLGMSTSDAMSVLDYVQYVFTEGGVQEAFATVTSAVRNSLLAADASDPNNVVNPEPIINVANIASMCGRMLQLMRGIAKNSKGELLNMIIDSIETTKDQSGTRVPSGIKLTAAQKQKISDALDKQLAAKEKLKDTEAKMEAAIQDGTINDSHFTDVVKAQRSHDAAARVLFDITNAYRPLLITEWYLGTITKALLSLRSSIIGLYSNIENAWTNNPLNKGARIMLDYVFATAFPLTGRTTFGNISGGKIDFETFKFVQKLAWRNAGHQIINQLRNGQSDTPSLDMAYTEHMHSTNAFKDLTLGYRILMGMVSKGNMTDEEFVSKYSLASRQIADGTFEPLNKPGMAAVGKLLRGVIGAIPELSVRFIAVSGDRAAFHLQFNQALVDLARSKGITDPDKIKQFVLLNQHRTNDEGFGPSKEANWAIFQDKNIATRLIVGTRQKLLNKARALKVEYTRNNKFDLSSLAIRFGYNLRASGLTALSPFTTIPTNVLARALRVTNWYYGTAMATFDFFTYMSKYNSYKRDYVTNMASITPGLRKLQDKRKEELIHLQRKVLYGLGDVMTSVMYRLLYASILGAGAALAPSGDDPEKEKAARNAGFGAGQLNLTQWAKGNSKRRWLPGDIVFRYSNLGFFGFGLSAQSSLFSSSTKRLKTTSDKKAAEMFSGSDQIDSVGGAYRMAFENLSFFTSLSKLTQILPSSGSAKSTRDRVSDFIATELKIFMSPIAPNLFSGVERAGGMVSDNLSELYPGGEIEATASMSWIKAYAALSGRLPSSAESRYYRNAIGPLGEDLKGQTGLSSDNAFVKYVQGFFDPLGVTKVDVKSPEQKMYMMMYSMATILDQQTNRSDPFYRVISNATVRNGYNISPNSEDEFVVPMPDAMYRQYIRDIGKTRFANLVEPLKAWEYAMEQWDDTLDPNNPAKYTPEQREQKIKELRSQIELQYQTIQDVFDTSEKDVHAQYREKVLKHEEAMARAGKLTESTRAALHKMFPGNPLFGSIPKKD